MMKAQQGFVLNDDQQYYPRRQVRLDATLSCMKTGLRGYVAESGTVLNLSEAGCMVNCSAANALNNHLHIQIVGVPAKIACAVVGRTSVRLNLHFTEILPTDVIDRLAARYPE